MTKDKKIQDPISAILFLAICGLWSFTWLMGKYQVNSGILPELAVMYRFIPISIIMTIIAIASKQSFKIKQSDFWIFLFYAVFCCSVNFIMFYYAAIYTITSISAIIFSFSIIIIALLKHFFFKTKDSMKEILLSSVLGICGLIFIMWQKISVFTGSNVVVGALIGLVATCIYSVGSLFYESKKNVISIGAISSFAIISMLGSIISFALFLVHVFIFNKPFSFIPNLSFSFVFSYLYLVVSGFGLLFIMLLIKRIGAVKAAYVNLITPVVATLTSAIFEDYTIVFSTIIGIIFIFTSNYIAIVFRAKKTVLKKN